MIATIVLAASLATSPNIHKAHGQSSHSRLLAEQSLAPHSLVQHSLVQHSLVPDQLESQRFAVTLHPMTEEEKHIYPGRENWDKTEWYESQFKSSQIILLPQHVEEWHNGGLDLT